MRNIACIAALVTILLSCGKENTFSTNFGTSAFINASMGTPPISIFDDTVRKNGGAIGAGGWSNYLSFTPGTRVTNVRREDSAFLLATQNFEYAVGRANTVIVYDTLTVGANNSLRGTLRLMRLTDDLTLPAAGRSHVRLVHAAQNAPAVDVTLVRTSATPLDSVTITNRSYIGSNPTEATVTASSTFTSIPAGNYSIRIKLAGTQTLARNPQAVTIANGGLYTLVAVGTARNIALQAVSFRNL